MVNLKSILTLVLLFSFVFSTNVQWVQNSPVIDSKILEGEYYNQSNFSNSAYAYAYYDEDFYLSITTAKTIKGQKTDSIQIYLNDDISLNFRQDASSTQTKNKSITNYTYATYYPPSTIPQSLWSVELKVPFKDLKMDRNCQDKIDYTIQILDNKNNVLEQTNGVFESDSCWATPKPLTVSLHPDTPQNQTHSPAALSSRYLMEVLNITPPGYPNDYEGAQLNSITLKLHTNAKPSDIIANAFIGPDGLMLGSGHFNQNKTITFYPDQIFITGEPRTLAIEFEFLPDALYLEQDGQIIPAEYAVEVTDLNFSGKYTKAPLTYQILNDSLKSNYVLLMQCTRDSECKDDEYCNETLYCQKGQRQNTTQTPAQNTTTQNPQEPPKQQEPQDSNPTIFLVAVAAIVIAITFYFALKKKEPKQEEPTKKQETQDEHS